MTKEAPIAQIARRIDPSRYVVVNETPEGILVSGGKDGDVDNTRFMAKETIFDDQGNPVGMTYILAREDK